MKCLTAQQADLVRHSSYSSYSKSGSSSIAARPQQLSLRSRVPRLCAAAGEAPDSEPQAAMSRQAGGGGGGRVSAMDGKAPEATDFANYFCTYAYLYHQVRSLPLQTR